MYKEVQSTQYHRCSKHAFQFEHPRVYKHTPLVNTYLTHGKDGTHNMVNVYYLYPTKVSAPTTLKYSSCLLAFDCAL